MSPNRKEPDLHEIQEIGVHDLLPMVDNLILSGWRILQILALSREDGFELDYSFGGGYAMLTYRLTVGPREPVPSITALYPAAVLYENEIRELFGVRIERVTPDWHGDLMGGSTPKAFSRVRAEAIGAERPLGLDAVIKPLPKTGA